MEGKEIFAVAVFACITIVLVVPVIMGGIVEIMNNRKKNSNNSNQQKSKYCINCSLEINNSFQYCPHCGSGPQS